MIVYSVSKLSIFNSVNSRRDRDGFQFDTLSHGSSHSSVQLQLGGMGTVSAVHTPLQGSVDNFDILADNDDIPTNKLEITDDHVDSVDSVSVTSASAMSTSSHSTAQHTWSPQTPDTPAKPKISIHDDNMFDTASVSSLPTYNQVSIFVHFLYIKASNL